MIKDELVKLVKLNRINIKINELESLKGSIPQEISELKDKESQIGIKLGSQQSQFNSLKNEKKSKELELTEQNDFIQTRETRLKEIKNNKEYHAALKEIEMSKKKIRDLETAITLLNTQCEELESKTNEQQQAATDQTNNISNQIKEKQSQIGEVDDKIAVVQKEALDIEKTIRADVLNPYKSIQQRVTPAMSLAAGGACTECYTRIPAQLFNELHRFDKIISCPRCRRVLILEDLDLEAGSH